MWKALTAGLLAIVLLAAPEAKADPRVEGGIAKFKSALRLTPEQARHWPRVEAALREVARDSGRSDAGETEPGFLSKVGARATGMAMSAASMRRLVSAAQPLVRTLDDDQKREAMMLARAMGFGQIAARLQ